MTESACSAKPLPACSFKFANPSSRVRVRQPTTENKHKQVRMMTGHDECYAVENSGQRGATFCRRLPMHLNPRLTFSSLSRCALCLSASVSLHLFSICYALLLPSNTVKILPTPQGPDEMPHSHEGFPSPQSSFISLLPFFIS